MKKLINFLNLLILITILSIIAIFIISSNGDKFTNLLGGSGSGSGGNGGGGGGGGGSSGGNVITLFLNSGTPNSPVSQKNNVNVSDPSELANRSNGLLDPTSNSLFILGNDHPTGVGANPNVYLFKFIPPNTFNSPLTIDFTSGTNAQYGNLYIDQDTNNIYAMGEHNNGTDSDIFVAKINKNTLTFDTNFQDANPNTPDGIVLLDRGYSETPGGLLVDSTNNVLYVAGYNHNIPGNVIIFKLNTANGSLVNTFGNNGYATIDADNNTNTQEFATDILTDGTNLIIVGEQQNGHTTLMLFKVNPNDGSVVPNSLITIDPPSGDSFEAAPLDAVILNNKVYLGATLQLSNESVLAVFDLNTPTNTKFFTFKDNDNNYIRIIINDLYMQGPGILYT
jgi:hypothetical protein